MPFLELPHTRGCLVCGSDNPLGLHLSLEVDPETDIVRTTYTPLPAHIGFIGIIHGGVLATVLDEAMVWAATWSINRFCVCGELAVRYRKPARVDQTLIFETRVTHSRPRLVQTSGEIRDGHGDIISTASGKYVPRSIEDHAQVLHSLIRSSATADTYHRLHQAD